MVIDEVTEEEPEQRAERLKERVYVTFTGLAVVLALRGHAEEVHAGEAAGTLAITVIGTLLAVLVADFVSHLAVHAELPTRREFRHLLAVTADGAAAIVLPLIFMALAAIDAWPVEQALRASTVALIATLVAVGYLAVRRARIPARQKLVVLLAEAALGALVVGLELLAHG